MSTTKEKNNKIYQDAIFDKQFISELNANDVDAHFYDSYQLLLCYMYLIWLERNGVSLKERGYE